MINENRLHHILGVARKAYKLAKEFGYDEKFARTCFTIGWNHDIGYEFDPEHHQDIGANLLIGWAWNDDIRKHGFYHKEMSPTLIILNLADMTTSPTGTEVTIKERLTEIESRYGKNHIWYIETAKMCKAIQKEVKKRYNKEIE